MAPPYHTQEAAVSTTHENPISTAFLRQLNVFGIVRNNVKNTKAVANLVSSVFSDCSARSLTYKHVTLSTYQTSSIISQSHWSNLNKSC